MSQENPLVSVIVVNYNGKKWLKKCFDSLSSQTYKNLELIFVDNSSSDGSVEFVKSKYPSVKIVELSENYGYAIGNNRGYQVSSGGYIVLLNNDTYVEDTYIQEFLDNINSKPKIAVIQSKIVLMDQPGLIDSAGSFLTDFSLLYHLGFKKPSNLNLYNSAYPVFSVKGASIMIKKEVIENVGLFDEEFWSYYEETDFCHRVWIAGYECWYFPTPICYHALGSTSSLMKNDFVQFHNFKNKLLSMLKNFETTSLIRFLPFYFTFTTCASVLWLFQGKHGHFFAIYKSYLWNLKKLSQTLSKRKKINSMRVISDKELIPKIKRNPRLQYYVKLFTGLEGYQD